MESRLAALIEHHHIRVDTPSIFQHPSFQLSSFPTDYTLFYEDRSLGGEMHTAQTITCEVALRGEFVVAAQQDEPALKRIAKRTEKKLRIFLGAQYEEFYQAIQADEAEQMQGQFIEVKPDPEQLDNEDADASLKRLTSHELSFGRRVVYFDKPMFPCVYVGRVEEVKHTSLEEMLTTGLIAEVILLQADGHEHMADLFFQTYLYGNPKPPGPDVYVWPGNLQPQTFKRPKRPGHLVSFQMILPPSIEIRIVHVKQSEIENE